MNWESNIINWRKPVDQRYNYGCNRTTLATNNFDHCNNYNIDALLAQKLCTELLTNIRRKLHVTENHQYGSAHSDQVDSMYRRLELYAPWNTLYVNCGRARLCTLPSNYLVITVKVLSSVLSNLIYCVGFIDKQALFFTTRSMLNMKSHGHACQPSLKVLSIIMRSTIWMTFRYKTFAPKVLARNSAQMFCNKNSPIWKCYKVTFFFRILQLFTNPFRPVLCTKAFSLFL